MRVLVTGAAGFLGQECLRQFKEHNHQVIGTDKKGGVDLIGNLSNSEFTASLPDVDAVVHCAAVQYVSRDLPFFMRGRFFSINNEQSTKHLCERYRNEATHFINVGTSMMYLQTGQDKYSTKSKMGGEGVYSRSKMTAQALVDSLSRTATVVPCIIGGQGREGLFRNFVTMMIKLGVVAFPGRGNHQIHLVHVSDVASLILRVAEIRASGIYNAASPEPLSISQWIDEIRDELSIKRVAKIRIPLLLAKMLAGLTFYRILAREQLLMLEFTHVLSIEESLAIGWEPKYTNAKIVRDIARHIEKSMTHQSGSHSCNDDFRPI